VSDRDTSDSLFVLLVFLGLILTFAAVVLSAYLRLQSIGLGCEDWPACFGRLPEAHAAGGVPRGTAGAIHRFAASLLGLIVLAITIMSLRGRRPAGVGMAAPLCVFGLTVFLSVLGYSTPSYALPAVTLGNLGGGMAMLALLWWMGQRSVEHVDAAGTTDNRLRPWALLGLLLVAVQIALGAWTSASFAGPACTSLPGCEGDWASTGNLARGLDLSGRLAVDERGRVVTGGVQQTLHMAHRLGALVTVPYLSVLAVSALRGAKRLRTTGIAILALVLLQAALGVSGVIAGLPLPLVTAHNATAALLLLAVVNLNHLLTPGGAPRRS
jgi:cytochrome c oxidase assembly protein subunit 15